MQVDVIGGFNAVFEFFGFHLSTLLLLGGFFAGFYFIYRFFKGEIEEGETSTLMKVMVYLGVLMGVILIGGGINAWYVRGYETTQYYSFTCILAIVVGIALILRPIKDVPWAAIIGIIAGAFVCFLCSTYLSFFTDGIASLFGIDPYWILIILFVIILLLCYLAFKLIEDIGRLLGKLLSARPTSLAIMVICAVEAILTYFGTSIWALFG